MNASARIDERKVPGAYRAELAALSRGGTIALLALFVAACSGGGGGGGGASANRAPSFGTTAFSVSEDGELSAQLTATDPEGEAVRFERASDPASGTLASLGVNGAFVYRPNRDFAGNDTFTARVVDASGNSATATVALTVTPVNDAPVAANDVRRVEAGTLGAIDVLGNDRDVDGDRLTVTIEQPAPVGTAAVNADGTVRLSGLPDGFKGLTRFRYRVNDPSGTGASANAAIFVGVDPFRVAFAGDPGGAGAPEVHMTDFVAATAWRVSAATEGNLRLRSFVAADNGATVAYRREDSASGASDLSFVRTAALDRQVRVALPAGHALAQDLSGAEPYTVSRDGQWIAAITRNAADGRAALQLLGASEPVTLRNVAPAGAASIASPRFSRDGQHLYFLVADVPGGAGRSLYRVGLGASDAPVRLSAAPALASDDVTAFSIAPDQARIAIQAVRAGRIGLFLIEPGTPGTELRLNHALAPDEQIVGSTIGAPAGRGGSVRLERVAYTVLKGLQTANAYVADVGASPNPRVVASLGARAIGFRADDGAILYSKFTSFDPFGQPEIYEAALATQAAHTLVGGGVSGTYDASGNAVILEQFSTASATPTGVAAVTRSSFGAARRMGTPGLAAWFIDLSGADRAVALIGEGPATPLRPASARLALVNAWAPETLIYLEDFQTPLSLAGSAAVVVTY